MAISPTEIKHDTEKLISLYEKLIDATLIDAHPSEITPTDFYIPIPSGLTYNIFRLFKQRYIDAGWKTVDWLNDEDNGTIKFTR